MYLLSHVRYRIFGLLYILVVFALLHLITTKVGYQYHATLQYHFDVTKQQSRVTSTHKKTFPVDKLTFHLPQDNKQYHFLQLNHQGHLVQDFFIPTHPAKQNFYVTYPLDASYFIKYPYLGYMVEIFDQGGQLLWDLKESRYLHSSLDGRFVAAIAGDQSKIEIMNPSFSHITKIEGFMLIHHQLTQNTRNNTFDACFGFLNGDVIFSQFNTAGKSKHYMIRTRKVLKSLICDLEQGFFWAHVYNKNTPSPKDQLVKKNIDVNSFKPYQTSNIHTSETFLDKDNYFIYTNPQEANELIFSITLPYVSINSIPLSICCGKKLIAIVPTESPTNLFIWFISPTGQTHKKFLWNIEKHQEPLENFRIDGTAKYALVSSLKRIVLFHSDYIILEQDIKNTQKTVALDKFFAVQDKYSVYAFEIVE